MERVAAAARTALDNGHGALSGQVLWEKVRLLGCVIGRNREWTITSDCEIGWTKYMTWKYPVEVVVTNPGLFKAAGAIEAAATL